MFDLRKIFDLRKFFAVPKNFLKSKIHCTNLFQFEQIVSLISNFLKILGIQPKIAKVLLGH